METIELRTRLQLRRIEKLPDQNVIHGSKRRRKSLIPKKPEPTATNNKKLRQRGVYATNFVEIGILYALTNGDPIWKFSRDKGLSVRVPESGYEFSNGYLCLCQNNTFKGGKFVSISRKIVRPKKSIRVNAEVLLLLQKEKRITFVRQF